jgi:hypothetical protein
LRISELRRKFDYDEPSILIVEGHSTHVTPRVIALFGARNVIMIRLVAHSSHLAQPLDLCVFGLFKIFYRKERQSKKNERGNSKDLPGITGVEMSQTILAALRVQEHNQ